MTDPEVLTLVSRVIDDAGTPEERAEFELLSSTDPEIARLFHELDATTTFLASLPIKEPPPHLRERILSALPEKRFAPAAVTRVSLIERLADQLRLAVRTTHSYGYAYALALGLVLGFSGYAFVHAGGESPVAADAFGTIGAAGTASSVVSHQIVADGITGFYSIESSAEGFALTVSMDTYAPAQLLIEYDPLQVRWLGIAATEAGALPLVNSQDGGIGVDVIDHAHLRLSFGSSLPSPSLTAVIYQKGVEVGRLALN